jgi:flagellar basal body-associated protein FliL
MPADSPAPAPASTPAPRGKGFLPVLITMACVLGGSLLGAVAVPKVVARFEKPEAPPPPPPEPKEENGGITLKPVVVVVNLADERGRRYVKAGVVLQAKDEKAKDELEKRAFEVRDLLNSILAEKRIQDVDSKEKKDQLRREIQLAINEGLKLPDGVHRVYFDQFIIE